MILVGHNLGSDLTLLVRNGIPLPKAQYFDTEVAARWCWPDQRDYTLDTLTLQTTSMGQWRPTSTKKLHIEDFDAMPDDVLAQRCGGDAEAAHRLYGVLAPEVLRLGPIWTLAMDTLPILAVIGGVGMAVNRTALEQKRRETERWLIKERTNLERLLGIENLASHQQVASALFGRTWRAEPLRKTTQGWSTDRTSLLWARYVAGERKQDTLVSLCSRLLEWSKQDKLHSTYYVGWQEALGRDGRIHSFYSLGRTSTGRLASSKANLQNVPDVVRTLVIPGKGYDTILQADVKQIELCTAALVSRDTVLIKWLREGQDIHAKTAARVLGLPSPNTEEEAAAFKRTYSNERAVGKMANFSSMFRVGDESLSWKIFHDTEGQVWLPEDEAQKYIDAFDDTFRGFAQHTRDRRYALHQGEEIVSPFGRRWRLPANPEGWRRSINFPIQSAASDLLLMVLRVLSHQLRGWNTRVIGEVHDALVFETVRHEVNALTQLLHDVFGSLDTSEFGFHLPVPLRIEITKGPSWGHLTPVD